MSLKSLSGRLKHTDEERPARSCGPMTKLRALFPSGGLNIHRLQSQREWISVWIGFNLPLGVFSISPQEHKCTSFVLCINVARCLTACSCKRSDRDLKRAGPLQKRRPNTKTTTEHQMHSQTIGPSAGIWHFLCVFPLLS